MGAGGGGGGGGSANRPAKAAGLTGVLPNSLGGIPYHRPWLLCSPEDLSTDHRGCSIRGGGKSQTPGNEATLTFRRAPAPLDKAVIFLDF